MSGAGAVTMAVTTEALRRARPLLNVAGLARAAGIPEQTLFAKLRRGTALSGEEARAIGRALVDVGLALRPGAQAGDTAQG